VQGYISVIPEIPRLSERGNERQGYFTEAEFQELYQHLPTYLGDFAYFGYLTGWRKSEIASLTWSCLDWTAMVVRLKTSKNGESRVFPIQEGGVLEELLMERLALENGEYVFHQGNGKPVGDISTAWRTANKRAGMDKLFHDLRRTVVRNLIARKIPERLVMALCGHKTNHMLHRYHVVIEHDLKEVVERTEAQY
jgi:integrase